MANAVKQLNNKEHMGFGEMVNNILEQLQTQDGQPLKRMTIFIGEEHKQDNIALFNNWWQWYDAYLVDEIK